MRHRPLAALASSLAAVVALTSASSTPASADPGLGSARSYRVNAYHARWDPCRPITYSVNLAGAPAGALADVKGAIARLHSATGMTFVYAGRTAVTPQADYGDKDEGSTRSTVVIAWARPWGKAAPAPKGYSNALRPNGEFGAGGRKFRSWYDSETDIHLPLQIMGGFVVLDVKSNSLPAGFVSSARSSRGALLLHELGHVVGLDHVNDTTQIMNTFIIPRPSYGSGDLAGLAKLGIKAGCVS